MAVKYQGGKALPMSSPQEIQGLKELARHLSEANRLAEQVLRRDGGDSDLKLVRNSIMEARAALGRYMLTP